jgi:hypothetical protein
MAFLTSGQWLAPASSWFGTNDKAAAPRRSGTRASFTPLPPAVDLAIASDECLVLTVAQSEGGNGPAALKQSVF